MEALGFGSVWMSEGFGREAFTHAAMALGATHGIQVATGIAVIWARDATAMANGARTLGEAFPGRFTLGLGVGSPQMVGPRGHHFATPLAKLSAYLQEMDDAAWTGPEPAMPVPRVIAALGPAALNTAASQADGAYTYLTTPDHTAMSRSILGPNKSLTVGLPVVVGSDADRARGHLEFYLKMAAYRRSLRRQGFSETDLQHRTERLVDGLVAHGSLDAIRARVQEHLAAGADTIVVEAVAPSGREVIVDLERIAPSLIPPSPTG